MRPAWVVLSDLLFFLSPRPHHPGQRPLPRYACRLHAYTSCPGAAGAGGPRPRLATPPAETQADATLRSGECGAQLHPAPASLPRVHARDVQYAAQARAWRRWKFANRVAAAGARCFAHERGMPRPDHSTCPLPTTLSRPPPLRHARLLHSRPPPGRPGRRRRPRGRVVGLAPPVLGGRRPQFVVRLVSQSSLPGEW